MIDISTTEFLKMGPVEFDQSENGWRSLVGNVNEEDIASLILEYIEKSHNKIEEYNKDKAGKEIFLIDLLYTFTQANLLVVPVLNTTKKPLNALNKAMNKEKNAGTHM